MNTPCEDPSACHYCGQRATGIGVGFTSSRDKDPRWVCAPCGLMLEDFKRVRRMDPYELKAREGGMEAAGAFIEQHGPDLSEYTEEQALMLCGAIWKGCADRLRALVRDGEAPF